jgi:hypothetical protein
MDITSWPKKWNDASLRRIATLPEFSPSRKWPMLGMLALGLVTGAALGGYAVSQRSHMKRLSEYARRMGDGLSAIGTVEGLKADRVVTIPPSNHRRKVPSEV